FRANGQSGNARRSRRENTAPHPNAADLALKGGHHHTGHLTRRRLFRDHQLLRSRPRRRSMREVRRLPAPAERLQRGRTRGSDSVRDSPERAVTYTVKEIFYTLQGEGAQTGRAAVFCRFSGCNLWSGREEDRSRAVCKFCDTDFVVTGPDGGRFKTPEELADAVDRCWSGGTARIDSGEGPGTELSPGDRNVRKYVVCTGGEPLAP